MRWMRSSSGNPRVAATYDRCRWVGRFWGNHKGGNHKGLRLRAGIGNAMVSILGVMGLCGDGSDNPRVAAMGD